VVFSNVFEELSPYLNELTILFLFSQFLLLSFSDEGLSLSWKLSFIDCPEEVSRW